MLIIHYSPLLHLMQFIAQNIIMFTYLHDTNCQSPVQRYFDNKKKTLWKMLWMFSLSRPNFGDFGD